MLLSEAIAANGGGANIMTFILPIALIAVFWLLLIRPQRKRQREMAEMQKQIAPGQEVVMGSGIYGTVTSVSDSDYLTLEISPGVEIKVMKQAVLRTVEPQSADDSAGSDADAAESADKAGDAAETSAEDVPLTHDDGSRKK